MAGRTSINEVAAASAMTSTVTSNLAATSTASLTTATTTVSAIRDVSTASGRPSRRDQLNSGTAAASATTTTTSNRGGAGVGPPRSGVNTTSAVAGAAGNVAGQKSQITSRSYAGSPTGHYPGPVNGYGRGNVPQSISSSAFTIGTSRYTR